MEHSRVFSHEVKLSHRHWEQQLIKLVSLGQAGQGMQQRAEVLLTEGICCQLGNETPPNTQKCDFESIFVLELG